jgi:hypothetical protein
METRIARVKAAKLKILLESYICTFGSLKSDRLLE